jgi:hypothetical protein
MSDRRDRIVILADVSPSMETRDGGTREGKTRFQLLQDALRNLPQGVILIIFSGSAIQVNSAADVRLDAGQGGTALHLGILAAVPHKPVRTIIISDGEPDSEPMARDAVNKLTGIIDVVYCGDPKNATALNFLQSLARAGSGGFYQTGEEKDIAKQLPAVIAGLLAP